MKASRSFFLIAALITSVIGCAPSPREGSIDELQVKRWQKLIAKELPPGSSVEDSKAFFTAQGVVSRYVSEEHTLYAPQNIEPERKAILIFLVIKSYDIRCHYSNDDLLTDCSVVASRKRWDR